MEQATDFIARCKAWQIFLVLVVLPIVFQVFNLSDLSPPDTTTPEATREAFVAATKRILLFSLFYFCLFMAWLLSIGFAANRRIDVSIRPGCRLAIGCAAGILGYFLFAQFYFPRPGVAPSGHFVTFHLLSMAAMFYLLAFSARNIMMADRQAKVTFFDYAGPFFLLWFFPIGVWFVQPRVNRIVAGH